MAWTAPKTWDETVVTAAMLNEQIRDNFLALDQPQHTGASGDGFSNLDVGGTYTGQTNMTLASNTEPIGQLGELRRQGDEVRYINGVTVLLSADADASIPSARTLGTGATQAAAGNHTH